MIGGYADEGRSVILQPALIGEDRAGQLPALPLLRSSPERMPGRYRASIPVPSLSTTPSLVSAAGLHSPSALLPPAFTWLASPAMATPLTGVDPFNSDDGE